jgi:hypothetical protein
MKINKIKAAVSCGENLLYWVAHLQLKNPKIEGTNH